MKGHWKKQFNYEYLGSYSLEGKRELVVTITKLSNEVVTGQQGRKEDCFVVYFKSWSKLGNIGENLCLWNGILQVGEHWRELLCLVD